MTMSASSSGVDDTSLALHSGAYVERYMAKPISRVSNLVAKMGLTPQNRIADFACGNGMLLQAIGDAFASYDGIDFSPDFVDAAEEWAKKTGRKRYRFHCCNIRDFCANNPQRFDVATTLDFSEHIEDPLAIEIFAAIRRSLMPGGRLFLHTPNLGFFLERAKQIGIIPQFPEHVAVRNGRQTKKLLEGAGFDPGTIAVSHVPHYNLLKALHPLSKLPLIGDAFAARLWIEAAA
jgi:2-polyprenyl-3-methyl-5-hydroxy-6-metoxy-1,4-benzoquinol methylase